MTIASLKESIEGKTFSPTPIILVDNSGIVGVQYINEIRKFQNVVYLDELIEEDYANALFEEDNKFDNDVMVYMTNEVNKTTKSIYSKKIFVITNKVDKSCKEYYKDIIIEVPTIEKWAIKDYVYSRLENVSNDTKDRLLDNLNYDICKIAFECDKITIFPRGSQDSIAKEMLNDGSVNEIPQKSIFDLTNALIKKDVVGALDALKKIDDKDINGFGLLKILYNNFLNIINIQLGINTTAESLNMKSNQFYAIKKNCCGYYSKTQLINIFKFLTSLDLLVKTGEFDVKYMIDYIVLKIFSLGY